MPLVNKQPVSYLQTDPRWANVSYSARGESTTIGRAGCGPTAMSMVLATWADPAVNPKTECMWALSHGYKYPHQGTAYSYFVPAAKRYGLECRQITPGYIYGNANSPYHAQAKQALDNGDFVIACMGKGTWTRSGHYVLVWGIEGNMVYINDPASTKLMRTRGNYLVFKQQVKHYWIIKRPQSQKVTYSKVNYKVKILDQSGLNCRKAPGLQNEVVKVYPFEDVVWLSEVSSDGWGKTDKGWIYLKQTERTEDMTKQETEKLIADMIEKAKPVTYHTEKEIPEWYQAAYNKVKKGIKGRSEEDIDLPEMMIRIFTVMDRLGIFNENLYPNGKE